MATDLKHDDYTRQLSSSLFQRVKPACVELISVSLTEDTYAIVSLLNAIDVQLNEHQQEYVGKGRLYTISPKLADYVFYPLTNLLKKPSLDDSIVRHILHIMSVLIKYSWSSSPNLPLIDQLYPLILFISAGSKLSQGESDIPAKSTDFKIAATNCIANLIDILPSDYYNDLKRLSLLGDSITVVLDVIMSTADNSQESIELLNRAISTLSNTTSKLDPSKLANILPGLMSKLVVFVNNSKNLHFTILINVLKLLRSITVRVFNDEELKATLEFPEKAANLEELSDLWQSAESMPKISINLPLTNKFRNKEWLSTTAEQVKKSLTVLFKGLLITSTQNKLKVQTKPQLSQCIIGFVADILNNCSVSLFKEFVPLGIDILSLTISIMDEDSDLEELEILEISKDFASASHPAPVYDLVKDKLLDLVDNKMSILSFSTDNEKLSSYLVSIKLTFSILFESGQYSTRELTAWKSKILKQFSKHLHEGFSYSNSQKTLQFTKERLLSILGGQEQIKNEQNSESTIPNSDNKLDNIELPASINAKKVTKFGSHSAQQDKQAHSSGLLILATQFNSPEILVEKLSQKSTGYLSTVYTSSIERKITSVISFLSSRSKDVELELLEDLLDATVDGSSSGSLLNCSLSLWMANTYLKEHKPSGINFNTDQFLQFDDEEGGETASVIEEASYLVMAKSQELLEGAAHVLSFTSRSNKEHAQILDMAYSMSLDTIGGLSGILTLEDFRADILMNYLYPLLEALSFQGNPQVQEHAWIAIKAIIDNYYNGSLQEMVMDNSDYLIDSLSLKLSVASNLTPSLSAILLIIIQISGITLLETNQLVDILSEMFVIIDSYHGYSIIVEGFFIVFDELIKQVAEQYMNKVEIDLASENYSAYKPWGMSNTEQLLHLLNDTGKLLENIEFDRNKEYFTRKPNTPFAEQLEEPDSDDDDDNEEAPPQTDAKEEWSSPIPENTYFLVQRVFNYGLILLTHDSSTLKRQLLKTLQRTYPLLCTNYKLVIPIVTSNWSILMTLIGGTETLSSSADELSIEREFLIAPALEFVIDILNKDSSEKFLARKFIDSWEFLSSKMFNNSNERRTSSELVKINKSILKSSNPLVHRLYSQYFMTGLSIYERSIPDVLKFKILQLCDKLGIPPMELSRDMQNILYVIRES